MAVVVVCVCALWSRPPHSARRPAQCASPPADPPTPPTPPAHTHLDRVRHVAEQQPQPQKGGKEGDGLPCHHVAPHGRRQQGIVAAGRGRGCVCTCVWGWMVEGGQQGVACVRGCAAREGGGNARLCSPHCRLTQSWTPRPAPASARPAGRSTHPAAASTWGGGGGARGCQRANLSKGGMHARTRRQPGTTPPLHTMPRWQHARPHQSHVMPGSTKPLELKWLDTS